MSKVGQKNGAGGGGGERRCCDKVLMCRIPGHPAMHRDSHSPRRPDCSACGGAGLPTLSRKTLGTVSLRRFSILRSVAMATGVESIFVRVIEDFSKDCLATRYRASPARNDCDVCVSYKIWFDLSSLLRFWKANHRSLLCSSLFQWTQDESFAILS